MPTTRGASGRVQFDLLSSALSNGVCRWILPFSHDNMQRKSLVDQMAEDKNAGEVGEDVRFAQMRVLLLHLF